MDIEESVTQLLESEEILGDLFYNTFLKRYPDVQRYFQDVNMAAQAALLTAALVIVERYYTIDGQAAAEYLRVLGTRHHNRQIPVELYPQWTAAMLETLQEFHGSAWTDELAGQWRAAIDRAIERMMEGYVEHHRV